jgi:hypothetical protein
MGLVSSAVVLMLVFGRAAGVGYGPGSASAAW